MPKQSLALFISYAHEDRAIAVAVSNLLQQTFGESLSEVFLDIDGIRLGGDISESIKAALTRADVLIVVSTGVGRPSHSWGGFELGFFEAIQMAKGAQPGIRGKVITVCLEGTAPEPIQTRRYVPLGIESAMLDKSKDEFENSLQTDRTENVKDEFVTFLGDVLEAIEGIKLCDRRNILDEYKRKVFEFKKEIFRELKGRIRRVRKPQKQFVVRYDSNALDICGHDLPPDAKITSFGGAMTLFGIPEDDTAHVQKDTGEALRLPGRVVGATITWERFRKLVSRHVLGEYWCASLAKVVISAGAQTVDVDNSQVIASHDQTRRYRLVLTTSTTFYNNEVESSLYLVEALQRRDYGKAATSLLLKGLHIVCRFRFLFMEPESEFYYFNIKRLPLGLLAESAQQLIAELDYLYSEVLQADLHKPGAWVTFIPINQLEEMSTVWQPLEDAIRKLCADAVREEGNLDALAKISTELAAKLKEVDEKVKAHNAALLKSMSAKLTELAG